MARKRQLSDAFGQFGKEAEVKTAALPEETRDKNVENVDDLNRIQMEQDNTINKHNNEHITKDVIQNDSTLSVAQVKSDLLNMYEEKTKKEKVEDTHMRSTFLFRKDLAKRLDKLAKNKRGFKTMFMNKAIEALLDEMEKK
jgi:hypothetical protein